MANVIWLLLGSAPNLVMSLVGCRLFIISLNLFDPFLTFLKYFGIDPTRWNGTAPGQLISNFFGIALYFLLGPMLLATSRFRRSWLRKGAVHIRFHETFLAAIFMFLIHSGWFFDIVVQMGASLICWSFRTQIHLLPLLLPPYPLPNDLLFLYH